LVDCGCDCSYGCDSDDFCYPSWPLCGQLEETAVVNPFQQHYKDIAHTRHNDLGLLDMVQLLCKEWEHLEMQMAKGLHHPCG
jgi:hypothetical protein